jgi:hypothetical protein
MDAAERDAVLLYEAIRGTGSKCDRALIGILCTRTSAQLFLIKQAYYTMFSETLENHISGVDTCAADFHKVLVHTHILLSLFSRFFGNEIWMNCFWGFQIQFLQKNSQHCSRVSPTIW